jgi:hypothetical protein
MAGRKAMVFSMPGAVAIPRRGIASKLTPEERAVHFAELGRRSGAGRLILTVDETKALASAYELLAGAAQRARAKVDAAQSTEPDKAA